MEDIISIIVPIYNTRRYIDKCVESIVNQTYKNIEIILVDDGSTDGSDKKCDEWKEKDKRIKVIHKENEGASSARNVGIENAKGKYIAFIDSDDYIDLDIIEALYKRLIETNSEISSGGFIVETYAGKKSKFAEENYVANSEEALRRLFLHEDISLSLCDELYKKELFETIKLPIRKNA